MNKSRNLLILGQTYLLLSATVLSAGASSAASLPEGAGVFKAKCAACHGADGSGNTPVGKKMKIRDLGSPDVQKQSDDDLRKVIAAGKGAMPAFGKTLDETKLQDLVAFLRSIARKD